MSFEADLEKSFTDLYSELEGELGIKPKSPLSVSKTPTEFKPPIRTQYFNSGDFSPNKATDHRHLSGHQGVDLRAAGGTAVYPITDGLVTDVGSNSHSGNFVSISHGNLKSFYGHLGTINVKKNQNVSVDDIIGTVGDSGNAKGTYPHVHFQASKDGSIINPGTLFSVPKYTNPNKDEKMWASNEDKLKARNFALQETSKLAEVIFNKYFKKI
jgi:murein DD-endopeptidase MepM/ murein hydrolase activator NlpD